MHPAGMRDAARAMLRRRFADRGRDETAQLRHELEAELVALTRRAGSTYARALLVLAVSVQEQPLSASCLLSVLPHAVRDEAGLADLALTLSEGALVSVVEDVGRHRGVVVVRDDRVRPPADVDVEALARRHAEELLGRPVHEELPAPVGTTRHVEVHLPLPDSGSTLLLSFSTPLVPLFDELTELFLLMASTVQLADRDGRWR